ncbi:mcl2 [Symbiodinium natans]|uniref:Mcl2 protein n=1 Tax=Symbiodinium natans TaxID=878477 RepID=A0A812UKA7_9DINO|nr:mcl2 [Symbiodinium natans]
MALRFSSLRSAARRLRSLHFVPGGSQKFLEKALASRADALIIDLEDSVLPAEKASAREEVSKWMTSTQWGSKTVCVRINPMDTPLWEADVSSTLKKDKPDMLVVPKVSSPADLDKLGTKLAELEKQLGREVGGTTVLPIVSEVPEAPPRAHEIARHPRVEAVTWGAEDLSAELGAKKRRDGSGQYLEVFQLCRSLTLLAAKGAKVQAIDTVYTNLKDLEGLRAESETSADTGFDGKLTIHPDQIDVVNAAFSPSSQEVAEATELLEAAKSQPGAFRFKGQMVDIPHFKQAQRILDRADSTGPSTEAAQKAAWPEGPFHGKWLEELTEGLIIQHALTRTVSETDNLLFTTMTLNPAKLHLDYESAKATQFGKPLVNSMFTLALLVGMSVLETTHGTTIANLGFEEVVFPKPVFYGDTIRAETEVIQNRPSSSNPSRGIVTFEHRAFNQNGQVVCKARRNAMMRKRPSSL